MPVTVKKTAGTTASITWSREDDPRGWIARAVESDQLAYALEALGATDIGRRDPVAPEDEDEDEAIRAAMHTHTLAQLLERRAAAQVVELRDRHGLSWRRIASAIHDDPGKQSTVRAQYDSGRRHLGL